MIGKKQVLGERDGNDPAQKHVDARMRDYDISELVQMVSRKVDFQIGSLAYL